MIVEPQDPFYKEHAEECTYVGQYYHVIAAKGSQLYTAPQSAEILGQVPLGKEIWIDLRILEGRQRLWGVQALKGELADSSVWLNIWIFFVVEMGNGMRFSLRNIRRK